MNIPGALGVVSFGMIVLWLMARASRDTADLQASSGPPRPTADSRPA
ncbi:MAG TPA: hypothetical protein VGP90_12920 [Acidimicrobiia bacterium]|nr:hypothetical protein [Acidimicrobiia bacterium]